MANKKADKAIEREFIINRSKWRAGGMFSKNCIGEGPNLMLNYEGFMCCLGQMANQCGIPKKHLLEETTPENVYNNLIHLGIKVPPKFKFLVEIESKAISINDNGKANATTIQKRLKKLFKSYGVNLKFIGRCVKPKRY